MRTILNLFLSIFLLFTEISFSSNLETEDALYNEGLNYYNGYLVKKDYFIAAQYFQYSSKKGNSKALVALGWLYLKGKGFKKNEDKAKYYFETSISLGNSIAEKYYRILSGRSHFISEEDFQIESSKLGAELGFSANQFDIGWRYYYGFGIKKDLDKGIKYIKHSADAEYMYAIGFLGSLYCNREYRDQNDKKCFQYIEKAAILGYTDAKKILASFYEDGYLVKKDIDLAIKYYNEAAEEGNCRAHYKLGLIYYYGENGIEKDLTKALYHLKKAFELGEIEAGELLDDINDEANYRF